MGVSSEKITLYNLKVTAHYEQKKKPQRRHTLQLELVYALLG